MLARTTICFPDSVFEPEALGTPSMAGAVLHAIETTELDDPLDRHVEAHVHGGISLLEDVETIVLDRSFPATPLEQVASRSPVPVSWHGGFVLAPERIPELSTYRGHEVSDAASVVAAGSPLTPYRLGLARPRLDPTIAKRIWHLLAAFGAPNRARWTLRP